MKLSDIKGERTLEVVADIIEPLTCIATDEEVRAALSGCNDKTKAVKGISKVAATIAKKHSNEAIEILAAIEGVDPEEYAASLSLGKLIRDILDLMSDEEFLGFLSLPATGSESSTCASGNTVALAV